MKLLKESFNGIIQNMNEGLIGIDKKGEIFFINKLAQDLLSIDFQKSLGGNIKEILVETELLRVLETGKKEMNKRFVIGEKNYVVNRIPIIIDGGVAGAFAIFQDVTIYSEMEEKIIENKMHIDILNTMMDTVNDWFVVVDEKGIITMMSKGYKEFVKYKNPEGKHVREVIDNTRLHIVLKTGQKEIGEIQEFKGKKMIAMRLPIKKNGKIVGAIGKVMFKDISNFYSLSKKLNNLEKQIEYYKSELGIERQAKFSFEDIVGESMKTNKVKDIAKKVSRTDSNVLIVGESGTGKELFAHAIHNASKRALAPFVKLNCAAIPAQLLEAELFGYADGAFTGAKKGGKKGKFELANGGTIFLDEIGDMPISMQAKLLRVIQEKEVERVGGNILRNIDVRIIAATNKNLEESVKKSEFREDLFYRLNVMKISLPALRERQEDIPSLANALRIKVANRLGIYVKGISNKAIECLKNYEWHGNIRELENVIERAINLLDTDLIIKSKHLPERLINNKRNNYKNNKGYLKDILEEVEREIIEECLKENKGNKNKVSRLLGMSRAGLYKKIDKYNLEDINS